MITDDELEARLRRTFHEVALRPDITSKPFVQTERRSRRGPLLLLGAITAVGGLAAALLITENHGPSTRIEVGPAGAPPAPPPVVTGVEQVMTPARIPSFFPPAGKVGPWTAMPGRLHSFTVAGSPPFVVFDGTANPAGVAPSRPAPVSSVVSYDMTIHTSGGFGVQAEGIPLEASARSARPTVFVIPDWPANGLQGYVWSHLPAGTAYVTYSWQAVRYWERPVDGVAGFFMARPAVFDGPTYADWHSAPIPVLRAYDQAGVEVGRVFAPRLAGDDFVVSPTVPYPSSSTSLPLPPPEPAP